MGADKGAAGTLDAVFGFPDGNLRGDTAPFVGSASGRRITVGIGQEGGYRQLIAPLVGDRLLDLSDEIRHFPAVGKGCVVQ